LSKLRAAAGSGPVLILTHNNPDPDGLACGKALATLLREAWDIPSQLLYHGLVARAENRIVLERLTPEWEHSPELTDLDRYSAVALVDSQPGAGNNSLPVSFPPQIVIDHHHPRRGDLDAVQYVDLQPQVGATSTILYLYLKAADIEPDSILATAMFYGLKTDTHGLARGASAADSAVYLRLLAHLDRQELILVEQAGLSRSYFCALDHALQVAHLYGRAVLVDLGVVQWPDWTAEVADLLIRLDNAIATLCLGQYEDMLYLSLRTAPLGPDAGRLIQEIVLPPGTAGGHGMMSGGQIRLDRRRPEPLVAAIKRRYLAEMGETGAGEPILQSRGGVPCPE
jgi:nanoRNase/pAp phosphatase (c-di-AMP/oligoRNAs hydrolase)